MGQCVMRFQARLPVDQLEYMPSSKAASAHRTIEPMARLTGRFLAYRAMEVAGGSGAYFPARQQNWRGRGGCESLWSRMTVILPTT